MRTGVVLVLTAALAAALAAAPLAADLDKGRQRPPAALSLQEKVIWMGEWAACRHQSLRNLARELGLKVPAGRTPQVTAKVIAKFAEAPLWNLESEFQTAVDGCRNGILWRFYHE
ncbi:MAG TPA: hypothetical protein VFB42_13565 [Gaiellaceae bacterium]|nr:hypothetical protein [Gaiellaceae bacterium]